MFLLVEQNLLSGTKVIWWFCLIQPLEISRPKIQLGNLCPQPHLISKFKNQNPRKFLIIFSWSPLEILLLFRRGTYFLLFPSVRLSDHPSIAHHFSGTVHRLTIIFGTHMCKMMISPGVFIYLFIFLIFIFWAVRGVIGQNIAQNEK